MAQIPSPGLDETALVVLAGGWQEQRKQKQNQ